MKVNKTDRINKFVEFKDLEVGDIFRLVYRDNIYIKLDGVQTVECWDMMDLESLEMGECLGNVEVQKLDYTFEVEMP